MGGMLGVGMWGERIEWRWRSGWTGTPSHLVRYRRKARRRCSLGRGLAEERGTRRRPPGDGAGWGD
jgi:hypothetical protein